MKILSNSEISNLISPKMREDAFKKHGKGFFKAYVSAHTGAPTISEDAEDHKNKAVHWSSDVIRKIANFINKPFYFGHHQARNESVGESVTAGTIDRAGKTYSFVIGYIKDKFKEAVSKMDCVSIEAEVTAEPVNGSLIVKDIHDVQAIALANSKESRPAFPEALELATIHNTTTGKLILNLEMTEDLELSEKEPEPVKPRQGKSMNLKEIKEAIEANQWTVDQIFKKELLIEHPAVKDRVQTEINKQKAEYDANLAKMKTEAAAGKFQATLSDILASQEHPESLKKLLEKRKDHFALKGDDFNKSVTEFVDSVKKEHQELSEAGIISDKPTVTRPPEKKISQPAANQKTGVNRFWQD